MRRVACGRKPHPPSLVVIVDGRWWGRRRRIAIFCDKLTNVGLLTLCVLKYLMKTFVKVPEKMRLPFFSSISE